MHSVSPLKILQGSLLQMEGAFLADVLRSLSVEQPSTYCVKGMKKDDVIREFEFLKACY